jgi:hypothetical protein
MLNDDEIENMEWEFEPLDIWEEPKTFAQLFDRFKRLRVMKKFCEKYNIQFGMRAKNEQQTNKKAL